MNHKILTNITDNLKDSQRKLGLDITDMTKADIDNQLEVTKIQKSVSRNDYFTWATSGYSILMIFVGVFTIAYFLCKRRRGKSDKMSVTISENKREPATTPVTIPLPTAPMTSPATTPLTVPVNTLVSASVTAPPPAPTPPPASEPAILPVTISEPKPETSPRQTPKTDTDIGKPITAKVPVNF